MSTTKRPRTNENDFINYTLSTPIIKRPRLKAQPFTPAQVQNLQEEHAKKREEAAIEKLRSEQKARVENVLNCITGTGYTTLYEFIDELLTIRDQQISSRVSKMLGRHGNAIMNAIRSRQPDMVKEFALDLTGELLAEEGQKLAEFLRPSQGQTTSDVLEQFSLERIMSEAEVIAPSLCKMLRLVAISEGSQEKDTIRKDRSLVCHDLTSVSRSCWLTQIDSGSRHCHLHAGSNAQRTCERVSDHHVYLFARMRRVPHAIRCPQSRRFYVIVHLRHQQN